MKKVININFQGTVVPIEETAYETLRQYIDSLRQYFADEEGRDEIINDIEGRISELFQHRLKDGATCITDADVSQIINNIGRPKDFDEASAGSESQDEKENEQKHSYRYDRQNTGRRLYRDKSESILGGVCSGIGLFLGINPWIVRILFILSGLGLVAYIILWIFLPADYEPNTGTYKKLYRNPDDKILGGVCGGIASYFNINSWIPRILFLLPFVSLMFRWQHFEYWTFPNFFQFTFSPGSMMVYIIMWLVIPEAKTTSEKLQMKGEKVDLNSIKDSVTKEMKEVGEKMEKLGKQAGDYMKEKSPYMRSEFTQTVNNTGGLLGRIIVMIVKIFVYIILGSIAFALLVAMFGIAIAAIGVFPLKDFLIADGWQNVLAWLTLIFFIGVPVVGTIVFVIRQLSGRRSRNHYIRNTSIGLWVFGWICLFALISFVGRNFKYVSSVNEQQIELSDPTVDYLEVRPIQNQSFRWRSWIDFEPYSNFGITNDTALIPNVRLTITKSTNDEYAVRYYKISNGPTRQTADENASKIEVKAYQQDSAFYLDNVIGINTNDKFRNQHVEVAIAVPVNHRIKIDSRFYNNGNTSFYFSNRRTDSYSGDISPYTGYRFLRGREYIMKENGLQEVNTPDADENYRYNRSEKFDSLKDVQEKQIRKMEKSIDSAREAHKKEMKRVEDSLRKEKEDIERKLENLQASVISSLTFHTSQLQFPIPAFLSYL